MTMKRERIGRSGLEISEFGLGGTGLGNMYSAVEESTALDTVRAAYSAGIRLFDTAPIYGYGLSETRLGRALAELPRDSFAVSTKVGYTLVPLAENEQSWNLWDKAPPFRSEYRFTREAAERSVEASLARLGLDRVDMVAIHDPDECAGVHDMGARNHFDEAMEGAYAYLSGLRAQGVIKALGVGMNSWEMLCDFARAGDFDYFLVAGRYTLLDQEAIATLLPMCLERDIRVIIGGPFNSGILATGAVEGAYYNYHPAPPEILARVRRIEAVCGRHGVSLPAAALQFPLGHPSVACVLPGARSPAELIQNMAYAREPIPAAFWQELRAEGLVADGTALPGEALSPAA